MKLSENYDSGSKTVPGYDWRLKKKIFTKNWRIFVPLIGWRPKKRSSPTVVGFCPWIELRQIKVFTEIRDLFVQIGTFLSYYPALKSRWGDANSSVPLQFKYCFSTTKSRKRQLQPKVLFCCFKQNYYKYVSIKNIAAALSQWYWYLAASKFFLLRASRTLNPPLYLIITQLAASLVVLRIEHLNNRSLVPIIVI